MSATDDLIQEIKSTQIFQSGADFTCETIALVLNCGVDSVYHAMRWMLQSGEVRSDSPTNRVKTYRRCRAPGDDDPLDLMRSHTNEQLGISDQWVRQFRR